ncbi:uncharacterized protein LOC141933275, partial [Strix aluco]|uniref:uncharacterized protein LOC141933275 n=1 Tax=Strix aluco TaxID=111821 RepID=UPI003DA4B6FA
MGSGQRRVVANEEREGAGSGAAAMAALSLSQLLDVAIGTPQVGAVNFTALHSLLQAVLRHLGLQDLPALGRGHSPTPLLGRDQPPEAPPREEGGQGGGPGTESLTPAKDPLQGTVSTPQDASVAADVGQMKIKIEENESSISKAVALSQDLLEEIGGMKAAQSCMEEDIRMIRETLGMWDSAEPQPPGPRRRFAQHFSSLCIPPGGRTWHQQSQGSSSAAPTEDLLIVLIVCATDSPQQPLRGARERPKPLGMAVAQLEASKPDHAELEKLRLLFSRE